MEENEKDKKTGTEAPGNVTVTETSQPARGGRVRAFWAAKFPDKAEVGDDDLDDLLADYLDEQDKRMAKHQMAEETFRRVAAEHPELLDLVEDLAEDKEMTIAEALYRHVDPEEFLPEEGEPAFDRMREARKQRLAREAEDKEFRDRLAANFEESRKVVGDYFTQNKIGDEEQKALGAYIDEIIGSYTENRITAEVLDAFRRARNYARDVAEAREVGTIAGKNAKIDAQRQRRETETDGLPSAGSAAGVAVEAEAPKDFLDEILAKTERKRNWMDSK